ncbi:carbamoyl-phosphate synthase [Pseudobacteriovorax antillogorgiicola]|uniref:carbamoyl-phosphate synthase n=1 Tax=Pseudobacteriovorax antillogorgiicola TaxID=1513793 RepID=UPI0010463EBB|nr:carbamoyl-phosphate synthase [Pseudobacteriovorax antillogorgiicola]
MYLADTAKSPSAYSKYLTQYLKCPPVAKTEEFISWLVSFGRDHPGTLLYPCCDTTAWLYAFHSEVLSKYFSMYSPSKEVIYSILNKKHLHQACKEIGIQTPMTEFPENDHDVVEVSRNLRFPILLKPQTQIGSISSQKGRIVWQEEDLAAGIREFKSKSKYESYIESYDQNVNWPMVQEFMTEAMTDTLSIAGFVDETGKLTSFRSSYKVMQKPRKIGIGLCFESIEAPQYLIDQVFQLCQKMNYFGAFETEFIYKDQQYYLIDFNPRYYSQMQFEIAREMEIPRLVFYSACRIDSDLQQEINKARSWDNSQKYIYSIIWLFYLTISLSFLSLNMSYREFRKWLSWANSRDSQYVDAYYAPDDRVPALVGMIQAFAGYLRHPRAAWRHFFQEK